MNKSDILKWRFPLDDTSTVYMSGKSVYHLVRYDAPGIIAPVELDPGQAQAFREAVRAAQADAWSAGFIAGHETARAVNPEWPEPTPNPYEVAETPAQG